MNRVVQGQPPPFHPLLRFAWQSHYAMPIVLRGSHPGIQMNLHMQEQFVMCASQDGLHMSREDRTTYNVVLGNQPNQ